MSLTLSLRTAITGLAAAQKGLAVTANNITNSNTPGYTRKTVNLESQTLSTEQGVGGGVKVSSITRTVSETLQLEQRRQIGITSESKTTQSYLSRTENIFGNVSANSDLTAQLTTLSNNLASIATNPNDPIRHVETVNLARNIAQQIQDAESTIQEIRRDADQQISKAVDTINAELDKIVELNSRITRASVAGLPTGDLEDQRDISINKISEKLEVNVLIRDNREAVIYMRTGYKLVDQTAQKLQYTPITAIDSSVRAENGSFNPITFEETVIPTDLTNQVRKGEIQALIAIRDTAMPTLSDQLENITNIMVDTLNALNNQGTAYPPPQSLTGTRSVNATDPFHATGGMRIAITNSKGEFLDYIDLNLSAITAAPGSNINTLMTAINGATTVLGGVAFNTLGSASIVNGKLVLNAGLGRHIAVGVDDVGPAATETVSGKNMGISHYFGLNDIFEHSLNQSNPPLVTSGRSVAATDAFTGTGIVRFGVTDATGAVINSYDLDLGAALPPITTIGGLIANINAAAGLTLTARINSLGKLEFKADNSPDGMEITLLQPPATATATGENFTKFFQINDSRNMAASVRVKASLLAAPQTISRGTLNNANVVGPIPVTAPVSAITPGDATTANAMVQSFNNLVTFGSSGSIANVQTTLTGYSALFLSSNASLNATAKEDYTNNKALSSEIENRFSGVSAVDIQEEMAQLTILENAHNASAQVLRITGEMFDALDRIIQ
ncbi:MAG: flagellar hook-associated protein FlgK [Thalassospira sp.]|nr:flagellar hook-associated protein FlgK [Thalassospira sp.]